MKKLAALCLVIGMIITLAACGNIRFKYAPTTNTENSIQSTESSIPTTETPNTTHTSATTETQRSTSGSTAPSNSNRLVKILRSDFPFYDGPSYDNSPVGTVEVAGTYTIVEEVLDSEGNLWGKLKSGVGWVDLSLIEKESQNMPLVTVAKASKTILDSGNYHYCQADSSSYAYNISISAHAPIRDVSFFSINVANNYERGPALFSVSQMDASKPLVASVQFPGPGSFYGLEFTDQNGSTQIYTISESGRNGSVNISPFNGVLTTAKQADTPWKTAYLNYIENLAAEKTASSYDLIYVDSDNIPELFISGSCEAAGSQVCSYKDGTIASIYLMRLGCVRYIPKSSLVYNSNGNMDHYYTEIYSLSESGFTLLFFGMQEDSYEEIVKEGGDFEYKCHSKYYITKADTTTEVAEDAYRAAQAEIFDSSIAEGLGYGTYDYSAILKQIANW